MPSGDSRKEFILTTTGNYFGIPVSDSAVTPLFDSEELNNFLDDGNCGVLSVRLETHGGTRRVQLLNKVVPSDAREKVLVFFKLQPDVIHPDNIHTNVFVSSMLDSPVNALYHSVQKIFAPLLLENEKWSRNFDPKLQSLLSELEAGLGSVIRKQDPAMRRGKTDDSLAGILTPSDEFQYWAEVSLSSSKLEDKERAQHFQELFQPISREFSNLDALSLAEGLDLVESAQDCLDDVWKQTEFDHYPEARMKHLMEVLGGALGRFVQRRLSALDLWRDPFHKVKEGLRSGISICERWVMSCEALTVQYWKRYPSHQWKGEKYVPEGLVNLGARLEEVSRLRTVHEQLVRLLSNSEQQELRTADAFTPFAGLNPLQFNPYTQPLWRAAVAQYERAMVPAEQRIAGKLRSQFRELEANSHQLLREFQRYKELVKRENIRKELVAERETLLGQLQVYIKTIKDDFVTRINDGTSPTGKNLPEVVNNIVWVRQLEAKVEDTSKTAEALLGDLSGFSKFRRDAGDLMDELQQWRRDQFECWSRDMLDAINDPYKPLSLQTSGKLMELDHKDGKLKVHYSERLVTKKKKVPTATLR